MPQQILLSVQELRTALDNTECLVVDCRFILEDTDAGFEDYLDSHIPGAVYAHLDNDLSGPPTSTDGRHPLPDAKKFASFLGGIGWSTGKLLIAYDDAGGAIAARLWWLMRYFGHDCAALLDGGIPAWWAAGYELESGRSSVTRLPPANFRICEDLEISTLEIIEALGRNEIVLADARARERFTGQNEPIDRVAGHIPGSVNYPYNINLAPNGRFKTVEEVRGELLKLAGSHQPKDVVHMCGSGVTACHNIFAAELVGLPGSRLYVGSWSEWIQDPSRPIEP